MGESRRVLLFNDGSRNCELPAISHRLIESLHRQGLTLAWAGPEGSNDFIAAQRELGVTHFAYHYNEAADFGRTVQDDSAIRKPFETFRPDAVVILNAYVISNIAVRQYIRGSRLPYILVEGLASEHILKQATQLRPFLQDNWRNADEVVLSSHEMLARLQKTLGMPVEVGRIASELPTFPSEGISPELRRSIRASAGITPDNDGHAVLFVSAATEIIHGPQYILPAIQKLRGTSAWQRLHFVFLGEGSQTQPLRQAIASSGISDRVFAPGHTHDLHQWLSAADVYVAASQAELQGLTLKHALALGLPTVSAASMGVSELLSGAARLAPAPELPEEPNKQQNEQPNQAQLTVDLLAAEMQLLLNDTDFRLAQAQRARTRWQDIQSPSAPPIADLVTDAVSLAFTPTWDYITPGFADPRPDAAFPNMIVGNSRGHPWTWVRGMIPHTFWADKRRDHIGFVSRDEASILHNTALRLAPCRALEIGCWMGWSAVHLALGGVQLDVIDCWLDKEPLNTSVPASLEAAGVRERVQLHAGYSPGEVFRLGATGKRWKLFFIDGNHDGDGPINDSRVCELYAEPDALVLFHDVASPDVERALAYFRDRGWNTMVYLTKQIMAVAWRGNVTPVEHVPDPRVPRRIPAHLRDYRISGL
jgi:glycosyltransferase involved in cell wall biosynthesis/predicted O-methyltransferase YrrM